MDNVTSLDEIEPQQSPRYHLGIAEQGKLYAIAGDHKTALKYYRYAIKLTSALGHPEVFFRHYLECVLESLEHMQAYDELLEYCDKAVALFEETGKNEVIENGANDSEEVDLMRLDVASIYLRKGIVFYKKKDIDQACDCFQLCKNHLKHSKHTLPLLSVMERWIKGGWHVDEHRIKQEQVRHKYFTVVKENIKSALAITLPNDVLASAF
ncbi:hypothetical protein [Marinibactrum halimedae]|uniref:Tetratricopeptide repeat protein n=1 Tax=Marinibactrum halimedae TaxID=1444977 RepID=A0AA37T811_9GAMM|nr:hypothetical protein [Marinibactrum halimedae]MCD9460270.1 hypothetical protein [Marinibactrum halimedae]GLS24357.1 hypothetical protein GCM10007877_00680 [Marinibactrum halimedae]